MDFFDLIRTRRSIRAFKPQPVEEERLRRILEAANQAPSAGNLQAYGILIVRDAAIRQALSRASLNQESLAQAPVVLAFFAYPYASGVKYKSRGMDLYSIQDATIACAYAQLAAAEQGLGSVWVGAFEDEAVKRILKSKEESLPIALLPIGYPGESPAPTPRRALSETARENS